jgi:hypothetical protein
MKKRNPKSYAIKEDVVRERVESHGVEFIKCWLQQQDSGGTRTHITYVCKCGEETEALLSNFYKVQNCHQCGVKKKSGANCYMWNPDRDAVARNKYWRKACGRIVRRCLKAAGTKKADLTSNLLGYTPEQLRVHIEGHPDYPGPDTPYHIDHIFPLKAFMDYGIFDLRVINSLDNLRPLAGLENLSKADTYDDKQFKEWLKDGSQSQIHSR